ncbi:ABC transporter permease [Maribellus maritimus]|uniref:ABC transporter permease n=1 Tax=Maribellus maritimus TaxID=2870838 RepID=UPI001EECAB8E|nr:ABC transporter permease [Maribellus maritimus]MCG6189819.1 ABC transporter permease [Maribellus maritimus]
MFHYILKMAFRNQSKNKFFSMINLIGLSVGLAVTILIVNYVAYEYSFDTFHSKKDRIYRVESQFYEGDVLTDDWATSTFGCGKAIASEIPGVEDYVRLGIQNTEQTVSYKEKRSTEDGIAYAGPSFFNVFDFKLKEGSKKDELVRPNTVIITEEAAGHFFKDENPVGKILTFASGSSFVNCEVTGVLENVPQNSHIHFKYLISDATLPDWMQDFWYLHETYTYLLLSPGTSPADIEASFPQMAEKYKTGDALKEKKWAISLVPLTGIHLQPQKQYEKEVKGNRSSLVTLLIIAFVILVTAWINYVNLSTAQSMERAKDVGVRMVSGAFRRQLIRQYMMESWLVNIAAVFLAFLFVLVLRPVFNHLIGFHPGLFLLKMPVFWFFFILLLCLGIVASGFYPAFIMTRVKPAVILRGKYSNSGSAGITRRALVVFQFTAALFLICGTFIVYRQVQFMQQQPLGVDINQTIVLKYPVTRSNLNQQVTLFADNIEEEPFAQSVSLSGSVPGAEVAFFASNRLQGTDPGQNRIYEMLTIDDHFIETFNFELLAGRSFHEGFGDDQRNMLINEASLAPLGFNRPEDALGKRVILEGTDEPTTIIGVVKNWHQRGLTNAFTPIMFIPNGRIGWVPPRFIAIKTTGKNYEMYLNLLREKWDEYFPEAGFNYFFLDQFFDDQYKSDRRFGKIVWVFTLLAFFISVLGLWALTTFTVAKKIKEVGVRKVLGARIISIVYLFSKEIIALIMVSLIIATPVSLWVMKNWLNNYAFHTKINPFIYLGGGIVTILVALSIVLWLSWKAATRNPVEALRYE